MTKDIPMRFKPSEFEAKWQKKWEEAGTYVNDMKKSPRPYYNLMMFPYPSAEGLHVGNMYAFTGVDIHGRFMRMQGFDVFEPIGLDGFGIHSENYAMKVGRKPQEHAKISQENFYRQLRATGNGFDWTRTVETYDPDYYRWTQWLFVAMFKHGLAYRAKAQVNWCPGCKTVLADEQVVGKKVEQVGKVDKVEQGSTGVIARNEVTKQSQEKEIAAPSLPTGLAMTKDVCERCSTPVVKKELEQWFFRITAYAERLLQNTYKPIFNWPDKVKLGQRNWIGKKEGININYPIIQLSNNPISTNKYIYNVVVFTTRPDTNFGATFIVVAPEHPIIEKITTPEYIEAVKAYIKTSQNKSKEERVTEGRKKTGVFTGSYAINQLNNYKMPIWVADFVLMDVGTGAVVGVPGHDKRDFEFAVVMNLPIKRVVVGKDGDTSKITRPEQVQELEGKMINSGFLNGLEIQTAISKMMDYLEEKGWGKRVTTYHLGDWLISRQRYWGAPIPMIYCQHCADKGESWFSSEEAKKMSFPRRPKADPPLAEKRESIQIDPRVKPEDDNQRAENDNKWAVGWWPVPEDQLPVTLPDVDDWRPTGTGRGPLAGHPEFYKTTCPNCGGAAQRETDVCDTFLDSSWYYLRYPSVNKKSNVIARRNEMTTKQSQEVEIASPVRQLVRNDNQLPWDPDITQHWFPVDSYIGGAEHTVLHLLYTRFTWMALRDWGFIKIKYQISNIKDKEGYKLTDSGVANAPQNDVILANEVRPESDLPWDPSEPFKRFFAHGLIIKDGAKMSKSKGNVVVPDEYIKLYGTDTLRTYLMFLGPFDGGGDFRDSGIAGMYRWLSRVWRLAMEKVPQVARVSKVPRDEEKTRDTLDTRGTLQMLHKTIKGVTEDIKHLHYNTAISKLMEFVNWWMENTDQVDTTMVIDFLKLLAPFAPHMTEELWQNLSVSRVAQVPQVPPEEKARGTRDTLDTRVTFSSIHHEPWPKYDEKLLVEDQVTIIIQINGKMRDSLVLSTQNANSQTVIEQVARASAKTQKWLSGNSIKKVVFVPAKLINFVV